MVSVFPEHGRAAWITAHRPARAGGLDPFKPHGFFLEQERDGAGRIVDSAVILLTNKECPWRCLMCDLWQHTLTETVPPGAIPRQIEYALAQLADLFHERAAYRPPALINTPLQRMCVRVIL